MEMNRVLKQEACMEKIEELRDKMISAAGQYGMSHPIVLRYSQELDRAHNKMILLEVTQAPSWQSSLSY
jgi:hypothetical protein